MYMYCLFRFKDSCVSLVIDSICWRGSENLPEKVRWRARSLHHLDWCRYVVRVSKCPCDRLLLFFSSSGSQLRLDQFKFTHRLAELQRQPVFQLREFESVIDSIRDCVAEVLHNIHVL